MVGVRGQIFKVTWQMIETTTGCHVCGEWVREQAAVAFTLQSRIATLRTCDC